MKTIGLLAVLLSVLSASAEEFPPKLEAAPNDSVWVSFDRADLAKPGAPAFPL